MLTDQPYNLILADDHILLRDALINLINDFEEFNVIARAENGRGLIREIEKGYRADIVLTDLNMPVMDGYETIKWLRQNHPGIKIMVLTMYDTQIPLIRLLEAGVHGILKKDIHPEELKKALLAVATGEYYYSNHTIFRIASLFHDKKILERSLLNETEIDFLRLACTDMTYAQIAKAMQLTPRHIDSYRDSLFAKLQVRNRVGMAIYAIKNGIVTF